jgi:hypothetical protein
LSAITDTTDRDTARASAGNAVAASLSRSWYAATIARLGYSDRQIAAVSDELVNAIVGYGEPDSIAARAAAHQAAGADHVILLPSAAADLDLMTGVRQLEHSRRLCCHRARASPARQPINQPDSPDRMACSAHHPAHRAT